MGRDIQAIGVINLPNNSAIRSFLLALKMALEDNAVELCSDPAIFPDNSKTLTDLGLTPEQALSELMELTPSHHLDGPEGDRDPKFKGEVCEFTLPINGRRVYVKIRLVTVRQRIYGTCISFHE